MEIGKLKHALWIEKADLEEQLHQLWSEHQKQSLREVTSELSAYDQHPADLASELMERDTDFAMKEQKRIHLMEIEDALMRMDAGTYGTCERCGQPIPEERLEAYPAAKYCLACEEWSESEGQERIRPVEEEVIPFHDFSYWETEID